MFNRGGKDLEGHRRRPLSCTGFEAARVWTIMETSVVRVGANLALDLDLECLLLLLILLHYCRRRDRRRHRMMWVRPIFPTAARPVRADFFDEMRSSSDRVSFFRYLRMTPATFDYLLGEVARFARQKRSYSAAFFKELFSFLGSQLKEKYSTPSPQTHGMNERMNIVLPWPKNRYSRRYS